MFSLLPLHSTSHLNYLNSKTDHRSVVQNVV